MDRQIMAGMAREQLQTLRLPYWEDQGTDFVIQCEFLDARWSTGHKKIHYNASIFFDESQRTVFFWELTRESGSGFSFGVDTQSSFQTGKTLFRKVRSIQSGPDGIAYEINLDLGAIPRLFKDIAKSRGWKFKTVLKREKAAGFASGTVS
ncbi:MAG TPA: hypothetical protein DD727_09870 [Clostridiales bacterium]|nr:hypothetical protein [Clostridiales bacterium]